jgi:cyclic pyranopterin phosphate synthase
MIMNGLYYGVTHPSLQTERLVDRFGRVHTYLRISVTDRCNLRCAYCMPSEQIQWKPVSDILTLDEIVDISRLFVSLGVVKIRLTGGEPTVRPDIERLIEQLANLPGLSTLAMTTNGVLLAKKAHALKAAGLSSLNVSLDTLREERFATIAGRSHFHDVMAGIDAALEAGFRPLRINTVIMKNVNDDELLDFVRFVKDRPINVRFIEFMPSESVSIRTAEMVSFGEMKRRIGVCYELKPVSSNNQATTTEASPVAKEYRIDGFVGSVSFITPMTEQFCAACSRLRLTADGRLKTCLFYPAETSLLEAVRAGAGREQLVGLIQDTLLGKKERPALWERMVAESDCGMYAIGG